MLRELRGESSAGLLLAVWTMTTVTTSRTVQRRLGTVAVGLSMWTVGLSSKPGAREGILVVVAAPFGETRWRLRLAAAGGGSRRSEHRADS